MITVPTIVRGARRSAFMLLVTVLAATTLRAQQSFDVTPVTPFSLDPTLLDSAAPAVVIAPSGRTYVVYRGSVSGRFYYTRDNQGADGVFLQSREIPQSPTLPPERVGRAGALAIDSTSVLHFVTLTGGSELCMQYARNVPDGDVLTDFTELESPDASFCGEPIDRLSAAVDATGMLHVAFSRGDTVYYARRSPAGAWSTPTPVSDEFAIGSMPSIAATAGGTVYIAFLARVNPAEQRQTVVLLQGFGGSFQRSELLGSRDLSHANSPVAITVDAAENPYVAFVGETSAGGEAVLFTSGDPSGWRPVEPAIKAAGLDFSHVSIAVDQYGAAHVAAGSITTTGQHRILYVTNSDGPWSAPVVVNDDGSEDVAVDAGSGFMTLRDSLLAIVFVSDVNGSGLPEVRLARGALDFRPHLALEADTLALGTRVGAVSIDTSIVVANLGRFRYEPASVDSVRLLDDAGGRLLIDHGSLPQALVGGGDTSIALQITVSDTGAFDVPLAVYGIGGGDTLRLTGAVVAPVDSARTVWIDTVNARVGTTATLVCRIAPPILAAERIDSLTVQLTFDPRAIAVRAVTAPGAGVLIDPDLSTAGTVLVRTDAAGITRPLDTLFELHADVLVEAQPDNPIAVAVRSIDDGNDGVGANGLLLASGCDIGRNVAFARGGFTRPLAPNPAGSHMTLSYVSPAGIGATVRFIDALGAARRSVDLPSSGGVERQAEIDLDGISSGLYFVELRVGERISTAIMVRE